MSAVNTETVVMMGAALAGGGNAQAQEASVNGERSINWDEARNLADRGQEEQALRAELREMLKAQVPDMAKAVSRVLDNYNLNLDELKDVKATLKADGEKLNYMIGENKFELSGGFDGKPLNQEIEAPDGSRVVNSQGKKRSSTAYYDADGNVAVEVQQNNRTGDASVVINDGNGRFSAQREDGVVKGSLIHENGGLYYTADKTRSSMQFVDENGNLQAYYAAEGKKFSAGMMDGSDWQAEDFMRAEAYKGRATGSNSDRIVRREFSEDGNETQLTLRGNGYEMVQQKDGNVAKINVTVDNDGNIEQKTEVVYANGDKERALIKISEKGYEKEVLRQSNGEKPEITKISAAVNDTGGYQKLETIDEDGIKNVSTITAENNVITIKENGEKKIETYTDITKAAELQGKISDARGDLIDNISSRMNDVFSRSMQDVAEGAKVAEMYAGVFDRIGRTPVLAGGEAVRVGAVIGEDKISTHLVDGGEHLIDDVSTKEVKAEGKKSILNAASVQALNARLGR